MFTNKKKKSWIRYKCLIAENNHNSNKEGVGLQ